MRRISSCLLGVFALAAALGQSLPVQAEETGVAEHPQLGAGAAARPAWSTTIMTAAAPAGREAAAQAAAIRAWADFTAWEYGNSLGPLAAWRSANP